MKLYFEDYKYRIESLRENLSDRFYVYNKKRTHGQTAAIAVWAICPYLLKYKKLLLR